MAIIAPDIGIDLGTSNTLVHVRRKGIVINEPTILVMDAQGKHAVKAIGEDARAMLGRTTGDVSAVRPLTDGMIRDFEMAEYLLHFSGSLPVPLLRSQHHRAIHLRPPSGCSLSLPVPLQLSA